MKALLSVLILIVAVLISSCADSDDNPWGPCWEDSEKLGGAGGLYSITDTQNAQEDTIAISLDSTPLYKRALTRCTAPIQNIFEQRLSTSVQKYYEMYDWNFELLPNELPDIRMILLGEERYIDSFDTYAESNITTNKISCEPTSITVAAGTFNTNHCIYESSDQVHKYETYHTATSKASSKRPLGGLVYYVSYKNDIETYKIELQALGEHITSSSLEMTCPESYDQCYQYSDKMTLEYQLINVISSVASTILETPSRVFHDQEEFLESFEKMTQEQSPPDINFSAEDVLWIAIESQWLNQQMVCMQVADLNNSIEVHYMHELSANTTSQKDTCTAWGTGYPSKQVYIYTIPKVDSNKTVDFIRHEYQ